MNKNLFVFTICGFFLVPALIFSKTLVFTTAFNRPDFIELQHRLFEKFLEDEYEFLVVNDANTIINRTAIEEKCNALGIECLNVPQRIHNLPYLPRNPNDPCNKNSPNVRHCTAAQWAWDTYFSHREDPVMIIDSDMFLIRPFSIAKHLEGTHLSGVSWGTNDQITNEPYSYLWLALIMFNNSLLPDRYSISFNCGIIPDTNCICDSGGMTGKYIQRFKEQLNIKYLDTLFGYQFYCPYRYAPESIQNFSNISPETIAQNLYAKGFTEDEIQLALDRPYTIELLGNNHFLHYRAGTNYEGYSQEFLSQKDKVLLRFFERILSK